MRQWYSLYLLGKTSKATNGWNERGNTRSGKDGRNDATKICTDDPVESGGTAGRCLTGTGFKSWGHLLDQSATTNISGSSLGGMTADLTTNTDNAFNGDLQVYDLVGNVKEWVDYSVTRSSMGVITVDLSYQGAGSGLPYTTHNNFYNTVSSTSTYEGLGLPTGAGSAANIDANDGRATLPQTDSTTYPAIRGGTWTSAADSRSPFFLDFNTSNAVNTDTKIGFRVTCDLP